MAEFIIGEPIPWEPITPNQVPVPVQEQVPLRDIERAVPFPDEPDSTIMRELNSLARNLGEARGGNGGARGGGVGNNFPDDFSGPQEPTERLAWYVTFRSSGPWGVFITQTGLLKVAQFMVRNGATPQLAYQSARYLLQNHETCHFLVDRAVLSLESNYAHAAKTSAPTFWLEYVRRHLPYSELEEAVCNAYAYRMAEDSAKPHVRAFMERQPSGYRDVDFKRSKAGTKAGSFQQSESQLLSDYQVDMRSEGQRRVIGLNSLMQYTRFRDGKAGDLYFTRPGMTNKEQLPVYFVR
jgi:hypothetical protein